MSITERGRRHTVMQALPVNIIHGSQCVMIAFHFQNETLPFCQPAASFILRIEVSGVRISRTGHDFIRAVSLNQSMKMGSRKTVGQQARVGFKHGKGQAIKTSYQVGFASKEDLAVRGKRNVKGLSHGISFIRYTNHSHVSPAAFIRHSRNACYEDTKKMRKTQVPFTLCAAGAAASGTGAPLDAFRFSTSSRFGPGPVAKGTR